MSLPKELERSYELKVTILDPTPPYDALLAVLPQGVIFGINERFGEEAERAAKKGFIIVEEAITGDKFPIPFKHDSFNIEPMKTDLSGPVDPETFVRIGNEYDAFVNEHYKAALKKHREVGPGVKVGKLCRVGVADGYAYYEIVKVTAKTCTVKWRGYSADRYIDLRWGCGKTVPLKEAEMYLAQEWDR